MTAQIPSLLSVPLGRMGAEVIRAVVGAEDCRLVGAIDNTPGKKVQTLVSSWGWGNWRLPSRPISRAASAP